MGVRTLLMDWGFDSDHTTDRIEILNVIQAGADMFNQDFPVRDPQQW